MKKVLTKRLVAYIIKRKRLIEMRFFKWFKVNSEDREFMYLQEAQTKQGLLNFLNEFRQKYNKGDLYRISHSKVAKRFILWDARV